MPEVSSEDSSSKSKNAITHKQDNNIVFLLLFRDQWGRRFKSSLPDHLSRPASFR